jgi:pyrimidine operon attenuation protein/uracil phosphoribosyltransferase
MRAEETAVCDASGLARLLDRLASAIASGRMPGVPLRLVGVQRRGVPIAGRLAETLRGRLAGEQVPVGAVDITLYRDDLGHGQHWPVLHGTEIAFEVEGAEIILVDDVLFTGRTVRAALNAICDLGRPACVRLAVIVDRGGRELPVQADYVGMTVDAEPSERVQVRITPVDPADRIVRVARPAES